MNCTDKELKRLREDKESWACTMGLVLAVVKRLDASEALNAYARCKCASLDKCRCGFMRAYLKHRKSKGL
jgi:hypothetical protein